jgi:hypothetical protein
LFDVRELDHATRQVSVHRRAKRPRGSPRKRHERAAESKRLFFAGVFAHSASRRHRIRARARDKVSNLRRERFLRGGGPPRTPPVHGRRDAAADAPLRRRQKVS